MRQATFRVLILTLPLLMSCQRSRLQPSPMDSGAEAQVPPGIFFQDPALPMELCWAAENEERSDRLACWHERVPALSCRELRTLEEFALETAQALDRGWRRVFQPGWKEHISEDLQTDDRWIRVTTLERRQLSVAISEVLGPGEDRFLESLALHRKIRESWHPWVFVEGPDLTAWNSVREYLTCSAQTR